MKEYSERDMAIAAAISLLAVKLARLGIRPIQVIVDKIDGPMTVNTVGCSVVVKAKT